ncbi:hypothetical protein M0813_16787 [Anaeramoeba flamelloides]|uniref:Uncharacterized protein n=1 Tax=Anaeramoeba flamelloides TaxID=1746091 RepID=A0ABQ8YYM4_9EUKA|nr:hypothetical protein M0813_16787 [Anaeramoeba flamelloides]
MEDQTDNTQTKKLNDTIFRNNCLQKKKLYSNYIQITEYIQNKIKLIKDQQDIKLSVFLHLVLKECIQNEAEVVELLLNTYANENSLKNSKDNLDTAVLSAEEYFVFKKRKENLQKRIESTREYLLNKRTWNFEKEKNDLVVWEQIQQIKNDLFSDNCNCKQSDQKERNEKLANVNLLLYPSYYLNSYWMEDTELSIFHPIEDNFCSMLKSLNNTDQTVEFLNARLGKYPLWKTNKYIAFPLMLANDPDTHYVAKFVLNNRNKKKTDLSKIQNIQCKNMVYFMNKAFLTIYLNRLSVRFSQKYFKQENKINLVTSKWGYFLKYKKQPMIVEHYYPYIEEIPQGLVYHIKEEKRKNQQKWTKFLERVYLFEYFFNYIFSHDLFITFFSHINQRSLKKFQLYETKNRINPLNREFNRRINSENKIWKLIHQDCKNNYWNKIKFNILKK